MLCREACQCRCACVCGGGKKQKQEVKHGCTVPLAEVPRRSEQRCFFVIWADAEQLERSLNTECPHVPCYTPNLLKSSKMTRNCQKCLGDVRRHRREASKDTFVIPVPTWEANQVGRRAFPEMTANSCKYEL